MFFVAEFGEFNVCNNIYQKFKLRRLMFCISIHAWLFNNNILSVYVNIFKKWIYGYPRKA